MNKYKYALLIPFLLLAAPGCGVPEAFNHMLAGNIKDDSQDQEILRLRQQMAQNNASIAALTKSITDLLAGNVNDGQQIKQLQDMVKVLQDIVAKQQAQLDALLKRKHGDR